MNQKRTSLERGLTSAFVAVIVIIALSIPVTMWGMGQITNQAQVLHDTIIRGELAYVKVASDADTLRAASIDGVIGPSPACAAMACSASALRPDTARPSTARMIVSTNTTLIQPALHPTPPA